MKTLEEIKTIYETMVEERITKYGLSLEHSRWCIKEDVLSDLINEQFGGELPKDKEVLKWFETECEVVSAYTNTELF